MPAHNNGFASSDTGPFGHKDFWMLKCLSKWSRSGFTLVELLVVITIIAVLAAIGLTVYSGVQKSGRMAKRIGDLKAIQTALEIYYNANKNYPTTGGVWKSECASWGNLSPNDVIKDVVNGNVLVPTYMVAFPQDPSMNKAASTSCYIYRSDGNDYKLLDHAISEFSSADYQSQRNLVDPDRDGGTNNCTVDGTNIWSWAVSSSCDPSKCNVASTSSCWW